MNSIGLVCFLSSVRTKSFSLAAHHLSLTHQAVSRNIQKLEEELGCRLLVRSGQTLRLTKAGEVFLAWAEDFEERLRWADELFYREAGCRQKLRIAFPHWTGMPVPFVQRLQQLREEFPQVQIELLSGSIEEEEEVFRELQADLYLVPRRDILMDRAADLFVAHLREGLPLKLVCSRSFLGADGSIYYRRLLRLPFLHCDLGEEINEQMRQLYAALCHSYNLPLLPIVTCPNIRSVLSEAAMGNGFSFVAGSCEALRPAGKSLLLMELSEYPQAEIGMSCIWRMQKEADRNLLWLVQGVCDL